MTRVCPCDYPRHYSRLFRPLYLFQNLVFCFFFCGYLKFTGLEGGNISTDLLFKSTSNITILAQEVFGIFTPLTKTNIANVEPGATFLDEAHLETKIDQATLTRNSFTVHDIELCHAERRSYFILDHTHTSATAHHILTLLDRICTTNIQANR